VVALVIMADPAVTVAVQLLLLSLPQSTLIHQSSDLPQVIPIQVTICPFLPRRAPPPQLQQPNGPHLHRHIAIKELQVRRIIITIITIITTIATRVPVRLAHRKGLTFVAILNQEADLIRVTNLTSTNRHY
jgi:hypothetical protein